MAHCDIQTARSCSFLMKVKCVLNSRITKYCGAARDALTNTSCSPDVRKHVCFVQTPINVTLL